MSLKADVLLSWAVKMDKINLNTAYRHGNAIRQKDGVPVEIGQVIPGDGSLIPPTREAALEDAAIVASGFTLSPNLTDTFAFGTLGPGTLTLQGSGVLNDPASHMTLWTGKTPFGGQFAAIDATGDFTVNGQGSLTLRSDDKLRIEARDNIDISVFGGSGLIRYEQGPQEGLHIRPSDSNDYILIPNEEQVRAIVLEMVSGIG